jgi:aryl-alcohol dehydrogenase
MRSLACEPGSSILITGGGAVGLSAVMGARIQGCSQIIVLEPHAARRDLAQELGATHVLNSAAAARLPEATREIVPMGVDYAFDTTGRPEILQALMDCLGPHGVLGVVGIPPPDAPVPGVMIKAMTFGHTVKGIIEGDSDPDVFIPELIEHYLAGRLPFDRLITTYPLSQINQAVADQLAGKCIKVVLLPER